MIPARAAADRERGGTPRRWAALLLAALILAPSTSVAPRAAALEPAERSAWADGLHGAVAGVHDPDIAEEDGTWYVVGTAPGLTIRSSRDLVHWEDRGLVFPDGWPAWLSDLFGGSDQNLWAPDLEFFDGRWNLYYSRAVFGTQDAAIGVATSPTLDPDDPAYGWTDHGMVVRTTAGSGGVTAIDPNLVLDEDGDPWLVWGSFWAGIALAPVDPATHAPVAGVTPTVIAHRPHWYDGIEGAQVVFHDGWWWLTTSWGFCCQGSNSHYAMRIGRSRHLTGPYVDQAGTPLLDGGGTLLIGSHGDRHGIGHGSLFESPTGWAMVHHTYDLAAEGRPTMAFTPLVELDGWPLGVDPEFVAAPEPDSLVAGTWRASWYRENVDPPSLVPPATVELGLRADGSVVGGGRWWVEGEVVRVDAERLVASDGPERGLRLSLLVDAGGQLALGRDQATAALRLDRIGPPPPAAPSSTVPSTVVPIATTADPVAAPPASAVAAAPAYTG